MTHIAFLITLLGRTDLFRSLSEVDRGAVAGQMRKASYASGRGDGKRSAGVRPQATAPILDSTVASSESLCMSDLAHMRTRSALMGGPMFHRYILPALGRKPVDFDRAPRGEMTSMQPDGSGIPRRAPGDGAATIQTIPDSCATSVRCPVVGANMHARERP